MSMVPATADTAVRGCKCQPQLVGPWVTGPPVSVVPVAAESVGVLVSV